MSRLSVFAALVAILPSVALAASPEACKTSIVSGVAAGGPGTLAEVTRRESYGELPDILRRNPLGCFSTSSSRFGPYACRGVTILEDQEVRVLNHYDTFTSVMTELALPEGLHVVVLAVRARDVKCQFRTAETNQRGVQPAQDSESLTPEVQGHTDRVGFETWIGGLSGDQRRGADFWAAERSKPKPASCIAAAPSLDYTSGCQEAQRRIVPLDVRRKTEPSYRQGWNAPVTEATASEPSSPPPPVKAQSAQLLNRNGQAVSSAVGLPMAQVQSVNPGADCSGDMCVFEKGRTPQSYCPSAGPCSEMTLFTDGKQVKGYTADFSTKDWTRSLEASTAALGQPKKSTVGPSGIVRMRNDYWSWSVGDGLTLTYIATSGLNAYGSPLGSHSIMLTPSGAK